MHVDDNKMKYVGAPPPPPLPAKQLSDILTAGAASRILPPFTKHPGAAPLPQAIIMVILQVLCSTPFF